MAQKTITASATAALTAAGTSTANGTITWTAPALPEGVSAWDSVVISGTWSWGGKGSVSRVTINGTNTSADIAFSVNINGKSSPLSISCVGNKNATGNSFTWSGLQVVYTYTEQGGESNALYINIGGVIKEAETVWINRNGTIMEIDPAEIDRTKTYHYGGDLE